MNEKGLNIVLELGRLITYTTESKANFKKCLERRILVNKHTNINFIKSCRKLRRTPELPNPTRYQFSMTWHACLSRMIYRGSITKSKHNITWRSRYTIDPTWTVQRYPLRLYNPRRDRPFLKTPKNSMLIPVSPFLSSTKSSSLRQTTDKNTNLMTR